MREQVHARGRYVAIKRNIGAHIEERVRKTSVSTISINNPQNSSLKTTLVIPDKDSPNCFLRPLSMLGKAHMLTLDRIKPALLNNLWNTIQLQKTELCIVL